MSRQACGFIAAVVAAPYLTSFFGYLYILYEIGAFEFSKSAHFNFSDAAKVAVSIFFLGTLGLFTFGIPIAAVAFSFGLLLMKMGFHHWSSTMISGAAVGAAFYFGIIILEGPRRATSESFPIFISMIISGAICGLIYWLIASKQTQESAHGTTNP